ncbi:hypothetical protein AXX12_08870 [Anaerosporomusa subterranea]|uniref:DUF3231 family protein n=1 Tax=Anaerosporomusa subterranea TaxID=1794912 RepID=A0A154BRF3_ANASB|nr:DUF3231 family protein [Anaerosporomusa subterranea]KYZ76532.1 hypothetical protein AXX12_08870 [Anaerosporomusa subterranea]
MTMMDKVNAKAHSVTSAMFDREAPSYLEATAAYSIIAQGRMNSSVLSIMYNHARDPELRLLVREALEEQNKATIEVCEKILQDNGGELPHFYFQERKLQATPLDIPPDARMTDEEIVLGLATMAKAAQMAILSALHQSYQPNIAMGYHKRLDEGLDFDFRILQLALNRGWLPHLDKVKH